MFGALLAQTTATPADVSSWVERFGFPTVCVIGLSYVIYRVGKLAIGYLIEDIRGWQKRWQDEHDLRIAAEKRADVAVENAKTSVAFFDALRDKTKSGDSQ